MACCILLDISSVFCENIFFQNFGDYFCAFWIFRSFPGFFSTCFEISVWNLVYTCSRWCYTSSSNFIPIWTLWPTLQPKIGQSHLSAFIAVKIIYRGLKFGTHTEIVSVLTPIDFCHVWEFFGPLGDKNTGKGGVSSATSQWHEVWVSSESGLDLPLKSFLDFFLNVLPYQLESWFIHWVGCTTYWVHVSLEWDPYDLLHVFSLGTVN